MKCTICDFVSSSAEYSELAEHYLREASNSDSSHVMWLNRNIDRRKSELDELSAKLQEYFHIPGTGLKGWIINRFVRNFFVDPPHRFISAMQKPSKGVLIGYVLEHNHFLKQWVRSCAYIIAKTDKEDVQKYEMDNIMTEMFGFGPDSPSHHELLIKMGLKLGLDRETILGMPPLPATSNAIGVWMDIAQKRPWIEVMAAMHSLELIATRGLRKYGAQYPYFNPSIFESSEIPAAVKDFLREGYEADASHSMHALSLVEKYAGDSTEIQHIQATFIRSMVAFDSYLNARLERGKMYENKL